MDDLYRENILDHGMNPRNRGILNPATVDHEAHNPLCGDEMPCSIRCWRSPHVTVKVSAA